jgi:hypothetical protein
VGVGFAAPPPADVNHNATLIPTVRYYFTRHARPIFRFGTGYHDQRGEPTIVAYRQHGVVIPALRYVHPDTAHRYAERWILRPSGLRFHDPRRRDYLPRFITQSDAEVAIAVRQP